MSPPDFDDNQIVQQILGADFAQSIVRDLGLQNSSFETQAELVATLGENILKRVALEILTVLPEHARDQFGSFIGSGDLVGMQIFLSSYIPAVDDFIAREARREYEATLARLRDP